MTLESFLLDRIDEWQAADEALPDEDRAPNHVGFGFWNDDMRAHMRAVILDEHPHACSQVPEVRQPALRCWARRWAGHPGYDPTWRVACT